MNNFLEQLNEVQLKAVTHTDGPVLVIAGAGSGKTRVLTFKIAHLLNIGIPGYQILALTFTNKAAREMKDRISRLVGDQPARGLWMGTFHSVFARILRKEHASLGFPATFSIYDTDDSKSLIKTIIKDLKLDDETYPAGDVLRRISMAKNQLITPQAYKLTKELVSGDESARKPETARIYETYVARCRQASAMDFDDLLLLTFNLFKQHPEILSRYQMQFRYLLIDEYQDTNFAQYSVIQQLAAHWKNVCVVGDDSQSIYSFRGARIENILNFRNDYPEYAFYKLEQNYRSTRNIVDAANSLIHHNQGRIPKEVWSKNEQGDPIEVIEAQTDQEEGFLLTNRILEARMRHQVDYNGFAVLYRTHAQSRVLEEACRKQNIPYKVYGSISFYQRKEIKDVLAYFRIVVNPGDDESLRRIINYPARGIGKTTLDRLGEGAHMMKLPLWEILHDPHGLVPGLNKGTVDKLFRFRQLIEHLQESSTTMNASDFAMKVLQETGILETYRYDRTPEGISKFENLQELINGIREYTESNGDLEDQENTISGFLQNVALLTDQDQEKDEDRNRVSLMTIHAAKGLEFKYIYIAGVEEDLFPSSFSAFSARELEEERRLFYVAITRAMTKASISYSKTRYRWGNLIHCTPSRFIREINPAFLQMPRTRTIPDRFPENKSDTSSPIRRDTLVAPKVSVRTNQKNPMSLPEGFEPDDPDSIQSGMQVEHPLFGHGKVLQIEGSSPDRKATIFFKEAGQKQLLLRFAKLRVLRP